MRYRSGLHCRGKRSNINIIVVLYRLLLIFFSYFLFVVRNIKVCHLEDGSYFGEIALVMDTEHRIATIVAVETCEIFVLYRHDFQRFISPYPDLLNRLQNVALEHLNKSLLLDSTQDLGISTTPQYINISSIKSRRI